VQKDELALALHAFERGAELATELVVRSRLAGIDLDEHDAELIALERDRHGDDRVAALDG
jgi:hypothetical protein